MKKIALTLIGSVLLMSSCGTYTGEGAATGAAFGSILGSAIGGISGGWRGHDIGTIVGMAGGAVIGAAVGAAADQKVEEARQQRYDDYQRGVNHRVSGEDESGFDATNSGDDRITFDGAGPRDNASPRENTGPRDAASPLEYKPLIEIRNARIIDADHDGIIRAGEECRVTFEVMNRSSMTLYDVQPTVTDVSGNKHITISPNLHVESIAPNSGIRYTASILAGKKLKDGTAIIRVGVTQGNQEITSQVQEFTVQTRRR